MGKPDPSYRELALPIFEEIGDLIGQANVLNNLGVDAYIQGRWTEALDAYRRSETLRRQAGDVVGTATQKNNEAEILSDQGYLDEARERFEEALRVWRAANYPIGIALATSNLARVAAREGSYETAHELFAQALATFEEIGSAGLANESRSHVAECYVFEGRYQEARQLAEEVLAALGDEPALTTAQLERHLGYALHQGRDAEAARPHFARSLEVARELPAAFEEAMTLKAMADTSHPAEPKAQTEFEELAERLGLVSVPSPPLP